MDQKKESTAFERALILNPLMGENMDPKLRSLKIREIASAEGISERTIRRWLAAYEEGGFMGLCPKPRPSGRKGSVTPEILDEAVYLRREAPGRSVSDIIRIMELEGTVEVGQVKRSTLQDNLERRGYSKRQLKEFIRGGANLPGTSRRFQKKHRNDLWQTDIKYLIVLPKTATQPKRQIYLVAFIDDATRYIVGASVYEDQKTDRVMECYRTALERFGKPRAVYTDNGKQFVSKKITQASTKLGIKLYKARPYAPNAKGKIEAFNRIMDKFVIELKLMNCHSVEEIQHYLDLWIENNYHFIPHGSTGLSPSQAWNADTEVLTFYSPDELNTSFTLTEERIVDKSGCISYSGKKWEVGPDLIGFQVGIDYTHSSPDEIIVRHGSTEPRTAHPLEIREHVTRKLTVKPKALVTPHNSRMLEAMKKKPQKTRNMAINFSGMKKDGENI